MIQKIDRFLLDVDNSDLPEQVGVYGPFLSKELALEYGRSFVKDGSYSAIPLRDRFVLKEAHLKRSN